MSVFKLAPSMEPSLKSLDESNRLPVYGAPERIRTSDLSLRRGPRYPAVPPGRAALIYPIFWYGSRETGPKQVIVVISIIIPTLNEANTIVATLKHISSNATENVEIILVDGGSTDDTIAVASPWVDKCITLDSSGRAQQMNRGGDIASGDILLFLHADTFLPSDYPALLDSLEGTVWGRFDVRLSGKQPIFRVVEFMINLRSRLTGIATGDQAIFISNSLFTSVGGYDQVPLMEDILISKKLKKIKKPVLRKEKVMTSSRRWEEKGILKTILLMWRLRLQLFLGWSPQSLASEYQ